MTRPTNDPHWCADPHQDAHHRVHRSMVVQVGDSRGRGAAAVWLTSDGEEATMVVQAAHLGLSQSATITLGEAVDLWAQLGRLLHDAGVSPPAAGQR